MRDSRFDSILKDHLKTLRLWSGVCLQDFEVLDTVEAIGKLEMMHQRFMKSLQVKDTANFAKVVDPENEKGSNDVVTTPEKKD